jgi:hypothetical protein
MPAQKERDEKLSLRLSNLDTNGKKSASPIKSARSHRRTHTSSGNFANASSIDDFANMLLNKGMDVDHLSSTHKSFKSKSKSPTKHYGLSNSKTAKNLQVAKQTSPTKRSSHKKPSLSVVNVEDSSSSPNKANQTLQESSHLVHQAETSPSMV